jgi:cytochrome c-type biogenesis protein CcmH/NrfG
MQLWQAAAGKKDVNFAAAERYLAMVRQEQKRYAEAERLFQDVLSINQRAFRARHENSAMGCC